MIGMMSGMGLVNRVSNEVRCDRVGVVVKIKDIIQTIRDGMVMSFMETSIPKYVRL